jgi:hypothetical protein
MEKRCHLASHPALDPDLAGGGIAGCRGFDLSSLEARPTVDA